MNPIERNLKILSNIENIDIPLFKDYSKSRKVLNIRGFPFYEYGDSDYVFNKTVNLDSDYGDVSKRNKIIVLKGNKDVDTIYAAYIRNNNSFSMNSSETNFRNRESVFNLTHNLLSTYWGNLIKCELNDGKVGLNELNIFIDALKEIGIIPGEPRHKLSRHFDFLNSYYSYDVISNWSEKNNLKYKPSKDIKCDIYNCSSYITNDLILSCIRYNGIGYLICLLYCLYGSRVCDVSDI